MQVRVPGVLTRPYTPADMLTWTKAGPPLSAVSLSLRLSVCLSLTHMHTWARNLTLASPQEAGHCFSPDQRED